MVPLSGDFDVVKMTQAIKNLLDRSLTTDEEGLKVMVIKRAQASLYKKAEFENGYYFEVTSNKILATSS